jgi:hypothetical protein
MERKGGFSGAKGRGRCSRMNPKRPYSDNQSEAVGGQERGDIDRVKETRKLREELDKGATHRSFHHHAAMATHKHNRLISLKIECTAVRSSDAVSKSKGYL